MTGILNALIAGVSGAVKDAYFNLVSLLLPGNGTNGAQNNTFLDSSTNNFTITRNGNTTQGTFSPFSQTGWGNYFSGSGALSIPSSTPNQFGSGDFTIETWYYCSGSIATASQHIFFRRTTAAPIGLIVEIDGSKLNLRAGDSNVSGWEVNIASTTTLVANTWYHLAVSRSGSSWRLFVNGTLEASATASFTIAEETGNIAVATNIPGYLSNWRVLKGVALYTSNFTVPTTPLTAISGTAILTCQSNRFIDNSSNAFTISTSGSPSVVAFSPFAPTAAYTTAAVGGSGYFDGTGDYLSAASNAAFGFGTGDFTIEYWVFPSLTGDANQVVIDSRSSDTGIPWLIGQTTGGAVRYYDGTTVRTGGTMSANTWNHVAWCRVSNVNTVYLNGTSVSTYTASQDFGSSKQLTIGSNINTALERTIGYISNIRLLKGTAVYTGNFTPPSLRPLTNAGSTSAASYPSTTNVDTTFSSSNTSLLLNYTNAGITDATAKNDLETVGNAQISTSVSKFGGGSIAFDGNGDWLVIPSSNLFILGTGDFTIEAWGYPSVVGGGGLSRGLFQITSSAGFSTSATNSLAVATTNPSGNWGCIAANAFNNSSTAAVVNTWYHLALVRNSGTTKLYVNGTSVLSFADTTNYTCTFLTIGGYYDTNNIWNGYIDDFRVTKGYARYTSNFTPPTAPFPVQ